jgi:hypothetical protein
MRVEYSLTVIITSEEYMAIPKWAFPVRNIASHVHRQKKTLRPGSVYFRNE